MTPDATSRSTPSSTTLPPKDFRTPRALTVYVIHGMYIGYTVSVK